MKRKAAIETIDDIVRSIRSFGDVDVSPTEKGIKIDAWPYSITIDRHETMFHWTLEAVDDPSDSDEGFAADPMEDILDSLSEETPGREIWKGLASSPERLAYALKKIAARMASGKLNRQDAAMVKKLAGALRCAAPVSPLLQLHEQEADRMLKDMQRRRWQAHKVEDSSGLPAIEFEIGEEYKGKIMLAKALYSYDFSIADHPELSEKGVTDSVTKQLLAWLHTSEVEEAYSGAVAKSPTEVEGLKMDRNVSLDETVRPGRA